MAYNLDTTKDSGNFTPASQALAVFKYNRTIEGITIHWWGDPKQLPQYTDVVNYLMRAGGNTSAHYIATGTNRQAACIVSPTDVAWATGSAYGNAKTISIECDPRLRDEDYDVVAELIADIRSAYGDVPLYRHDMWSSTTCPGGYDINRLDTLSYTKVSHDKWGDVTNSFVPTPPVPASQPAPEADPTTLLFKVKKGGKQIGAFGKDINAWNCYTIQQADSITVGGKDVTASLKAKFTTPSPTTQNPDGTTQVDSGLPVTEKVDYGKQNNDLLNLIWNVIKQIAERFGIKG